MEKNVFISGEVYDKLKCGVVIFRPEKEYEIVYANTIYCSKFKTDRLRFNDADMKQLDELLSSETHSGRMNCSQMDFAGNLVEIIMFASMDEEERIVFAVLVNNTATNAEIRRLEEKSQFDPLTKVYNRATAIEKINEALSQKDEKSPCALIVLDIDNFKRINDTFGHVYGDAVIAMAAGSVNNVLGEKDIMGRFGGDEFFAYIDDAGEEALIQKLKNINKAVVDMRVDKGDDKDISCSVGVALGNGKADYEKMFREADSALYLAKKNGKNRYEFYDGKYHGAAISYGQDSDGESKNELSIAEIAIEIASKSKNTESTIFNIMRHAAVVMGLDCVQIQKFYTSEGRGDVEFEYYRELNGQYNVIQSVKKTGYYNVADIEKFRNHLAEVKQFRYQPDFKLQFSYKFKNVLSVSDPHTLIFSSTAEKGDDEICVLCYKNFTPDRIWTDEDYENAAEITKILSVYMNSSYVATDREKAQEKELMFASTGACRMSFFFKRTGKMTVLALETGELCAMTHFHIAGIREIGKAVGEEAEYQFFYRFVELLLKKNSANHLVGSYDNDEDCVMLTVCDDKEEYEKEILKDIEKYCSSNPLPAECRVYIQAAVCYFVPGMNVGNSLMSVRDYNLDYSAGKNAVARVDFVKYKK